MAARAEHVVTLRAVDGVSQTFRTMGQSAQTAAVQLDNVGTRAQATAARMQQIEVRATQVGAALGTAAGLLAKLGQETVNQERSIRGIEAAYGAAADRVIAFSREIQASTNFSDEAARSAFVIASTLSRNYGIATAEIDELVRVSADLAEIYGYDLANAVQRTSSAIRGEAESAEMLGLTLSDNFVAAEAARRGVEGWTTSMTESEKAQFRLTLLLEQTTYAQGQAADAANTARGRMIDLQHGMQDAAVGAGGLVGPVSEAASVLGNFALILPVAGAGVGKLIGGLVKLAAPSAAASGALGAGCLAGSLGLAVPLLGGLATGAVAAAGPLAALAIVVNRNDEAQRSWNESQQAGTRFLERLGETGTDRTVIDIVSAFEEWNTVTTVVFRDTTLGIEDVNRLLLNLDETSVKALSHFVEAVGGVTPENIDAIAQEIVRLTQVEQEFTFAALAAVDAQRAQAQIELPQYFRDLRAEVAFTTAALDAHERGLLANARAADEMMARQRILVSSFAQSFVTPELSSLYRPPGQRANDAAALEAASQAHLARTIDEANQEREEAIRRADEHARAMEQERAAALNAADALLGSLDDREAAAQQAAQAERDAAQQISQIRRTSVAEQRDLEQQYARDVRGLQAERVDVEREAVRTLNDLETERREVAIETEEQLRDLAQQRGELQVDLAEQARDAEAEWLQTSRENLREQAALRSELQRTTAEAAREWQQLNAENLAQQKAIQEGLREALQGQDIDFRRTRQDIQREMGRIREDLAIRLADPDIDPEQAFMAEMDAERRLEDLRIQLRRADQDHRRVQKQSKVEARAEEKALEEERSSAAKEHHAEVRGLESETADRIRGLEQERLAAQEAFAQQQRDARADAVAQMAELAEQERIILEEQAQRFAEIEREKLAASREAARTRELLTREAAQLEERFGRGLTQAQRQAARETARVEAQAGRESLQFQTELQQLLNDGLITREEYNAALDAAHAIQQDTVATERANLALQVRQLPELARAVELERERVEAVREYKSEVASGQGDEERLDGPVVAVTADATPFDAELAAARRRGDAFATEVFTPTIDGDSVQWVDVVRGATNLGVALGQSVFRPTIEGDATAWEASVKDVSDSIEELAGAAVVIPINAQTNYGGDESGRSQGGGVEPFWAAASGIGTFVTELDKRSATIDIKANTAPFWQAVRAITNRDNVGTATIRTEMALAGEGFALGGRVAPQMRVPAAAMGRMVTVGETGPELALLPYGSLVVPHGAAQARMRTEGREGGGTNNFYGPVTFVMQTPSIAAEVSRQLAGRQRQ